MPALLYRFSLAHEATWNQPEFRVVATQIYVHTSTNIENFLFLCFTFVLGSYKFTTVFVNILLQFYTFKMFI
jgi:hypothetical protein